MQTKTFAAQSLDEFQLAAYLTPDFQPTLAIVFASVQHDLDQLRGQFQQAGIDVFGATSSGEILENGGDDTVYEEAIVGMLFQLNREAYRLHMFENNTPTYSAFGAEIGGWIKSAFPQPAALLMASGMQSDGDQIVRGVLQCTGEDIPLFGGLAGDDMRFQTTTVFNSSTATSNGAIALVFDTSKIAVTGLASSGWKAVGSPKTITKSEGNVVYAIDNVPATDVYREYLGLEKNTPLNVVAEYPLQIQRPEGYSVMRAALLTNPETKALIYAGSVPEQSRVLFCVPPGTEVIEHALTELKQLHDQTPEADALILFSCKGRHLALGPLAEDEIKPIQELWNAPLVGFYTYGEIGRLLQGKTDFHNETCVLVALKEKAS